MDCPNCGVYNPEERDICWRCDQPLPKPEERKKQRADPAVTMRRVWIIVALAVLIWMLLSFVLPFFFGGPVTTPTP